MSPSPINAWVYLRDGSILHGALTAWADDTVTLDGREWTGVAAWKPADDLAAVTHERDVLASVLRTLLVEPYVDADGTIAVAPGRSCLGLGAGSKRARVFAVAVERGQ